MTVEEALFALVTGVAIVLMFLGLADALEGDARARFRARAAASASSRRYCRRCSGCAAIQTSGKSDLRSTSAEDSAISN